MRWKAKSRRISDLWKSLPVSHCLNDVVVSVDSGIGIVNPSSVNFTSVSADGIIMSLLERNRFAAVAAMFTGALAAIGAAVGRTLSAIIGEGVAGQNSLDLPVSISTREEQLLKSSVL